MPLSPPGTQLSPWHVNCVNGWYDRSGQLPPIAPALPGRAANGPDPAAPRIARSRLGHEVAGLSGRLGLMRLSRLTVLALAVSVLLALAVTGCASSGAVPSPSPAATQAHIAASPAGSAPAGSAPAGLPAAWNWPNYHRDPAHTGYSPGTPRAGLLAIAWRRQLNGAVYGQPLAVGGLVIAATEGDSVYGLDRATGQVRWRVNAGTPVPLSALPCGDIDPLGITGTPVYDPATGLVYAVAETAGYHHVLVAVNAASGQVAFRRDIPTPDGQPRYDQQRGALALAGGRVYISFGGLAGDCGPYRGSVVGVPVSGHGPLISYVVPTAREGGIWTPGGPVTGPGGTIYVGVGNGAATSGRYDDSDSVTALTLALHRTGIFAPAVWPGDNAADLDLGSLSPVLLPSGMVLAVGKRGTGYLLDGTHLGGVAGQVATAAICPAFGGAAVSGTIAYVPCANGGLAAVDTAGRHLRVRWRGPATAAGSPVLGGGAVWVADLGAGTLYQVSLASGQVRQQISLGASLPHFASPSLSGPLVLIGTMHGVVAVTGA
jgi:polyvinyl alcohol dehydrogenase (cytochrome)